MSKPEGFEKTGEGEYRGTILGIPVLVARTALGWSKYHTYSRQPHWIAYHAVEGGRVLSDGNGTLKGALENAEHAIRFRGLGKWLGPQSPQASKSFTVETYPVAQRTHVLTQP